MFENYRGLVRQRLGGVSMMDEAVNSGEVSMVFLFGRNMKIINIKPKLTDHHQQANKKEVESNLFNVFKKYI